MAVTQELVEARPSVGLVQRWGRAVARRSRLVLGVWVLLLVLCGIAYPMLQSRLEAPNYNPEQSEFLRAEQLVREYFPALGDEQDVVVFDSPTRTVDSPEFRQTVSEVLGRLHGAEGITRVTGPFEGMGQISPDRHTAFALVGQTGTPPERADRAQHWQDDLRSAGAGDIGVAVTGFVPIQNDLATAEKTDLTRAEMIGLPVALLVMMVALGAVVAAAVPVGIGLAAILLANGVLLALSPLTGIDILMTTMASMIGLGIGIDYAMFVVSRFREELGRAGVTSRRDPAVAEAIGAAMNTAGRTVLASGVIVAVSVVALALIPAPTYRGLALSISVSVAATLAVALILLPALLAELGPAVNRGALPERFRPAVMRGEAAAAHGNWYRWAQTMMRRPLLFGVGAVLLLLALALPLTRIEHGLNLGVDSLGGQPAGRAAQVMAADFPPGTMAPITIVATGPGGGPLTADGSDQLDRFVAATSADSRVTTAFQQQSDGRTLVVALPAAAVDDPQSARLVTDLRDRARHLDGVQATVGGVNAGFVDVSGMITGRLPAVVAFVLIVSFAFLVFAFRSIVLPLKAIAMNLLATGAALGLTVAVFQWGWGESLFGFHSPGYLQVYLPGMVFVILFGLSMDYEVFLIRRMKERWDAAGDHSDTGNRAAVAEGIEHTARPITAAAAIMVVIFGSFLTADVLELKQIGFALAVAVTLDAIVVRMVLVPAFMRLFGRWNWWLPGRSAASAPQSVE
ncbi:MMPL family transporter [Nocardia sp. BMG51109]|uniref:MMPL family transporter n=1 Tax=Nocardia sp. BMG51109 TaxID=1056816 RepID=UPI000466A2DF|nr:MMPL family transporter [Nocardia sp. BMG51109]